MENSQKAIALHDKVMQDYASGKISLRRLKKMVSSDTSESDSDDCEDDLSPIPSEVRCKNKDDVKAIYHFDSPGDFIHLFLFSWRRMIRIL